MRLKFNRFIILLVFCLLPLPCLANPATVAACTTAIPNSAVTIASTSIATMYNMFPIKIGGIPWGTAGELEDTPPQISSFCGPCSKPPLMIPTFGVSLSYWEPIGIVEVTSIPYCIPSFGIPLGIDGMPGSNSIGNRPSDPQNSLITYQTHFIDYPLLKVLGVLKNTCVSSYPDIGEIPYMSEIDPMWQNDLWASYINPEVYLVANPFVQLSCGIDAMAANAGFSLDFMWWCLGSWGSMYPITASNVTNSAATAAMGNAARTLFLMHKLLQLPVTVGAHMGTGACSAIPLPLMPKSMYSFVPIYPSVYPNRIPTGRSGLMWDHMIDVPIANKGVYAIIIYRKVECCTF